MGCVAQVKGNLLSAVFVSIVFQTNRCSMNSMRSCAANTPLKKLTYPPPDDNILKFKKFGHTLEVPFTIFADFESLLVLNPDDKKYAIHKPSSIACLTVSAFPEFNNQKMFIYTGARRDGAIL